MTSAAGSEPTRQPEWISLAKAGEILGLSTPIVSKLIRAGKIKGHRIGLGTQRPRYRVDRAAIDQYLEETEAKP